MIWFCGGHGVCLTMNQTADSPSRTKCSSTPPSTKSTPSCSRTSSEPSRSSSSSTRTGNGSRRPPSRPMPTSITAALPSSPTTALAACWGSFLCSAARDRNPLVPGLASFTLGSEAKNAIDVPLDDGAVGTTVVGAPTLTFNYSGIGTSRSVYAQIVDTNTGLVVGNIVTPIPVTLDGRPQSVDNQHGGHRLHVR